MRSTWLTQVAASLNNRKITILTILLLLTTSFFLFRYADVVQERHEPSLSSASAERHAEIRLNLPEPLPVPTPLPIPRIEPVPTVDEPIVQPADGLVWNAGIKSDRKWVDFMHAASAADVELDLANFAYTDSSAAGSSDQFNQAVQSAINEKKSTIRITVRAFILEGPIFFSPGATAERTRDIDLKRMNVSQGDKEQFEKERDLAKNSSNVGEMLFEISSKYNLAAFTFAIVTDSNLHQSQCAQIAFSIWDDTQSVPLDYIVYSFPVIAGAKSVQEFDCKPKRVQGGFGSMAASAVSESGRRPVAALHLFEFGTASGQRATRAVYVDLRKYVNGKRTSRPQKPGVYSWGIDGSFSEYISGPELRDIIISSRGSGDYSGVAREITEKLFPIDGTDMGKQAGEAFKSLTHLPSTGGARPTVMIRASTAAGVHVFPPLSMLEAGGQVQQRFNVVYPLPRENRSDAACVARWAFGYPEKLGVGTKEPDTLPWDASTMASNKSMRLSNITQVRCYFNPTSEKCESVNQAKLEPAQSEALMLLAHHANGILWFDDKSREGRFPLSSGQRKFPPGSVAFINACAVASSVGDNQLLLNRLNRDGIDAMVVSPFSVDIAYGKLLSQAVMQVVNAAYAKHETPTLLEIFEQAAARVTTFPGAERLGQTRYEFVVLGNYETRLCK